MYDDADEYDVDVDHEYLYPNPPGPGGEGRGRIQEPNITIKEATSKRTRKRARRRARVLEQVDRIIMITNRGVYTRCIGVERCVYLFIPTLRGRGARDEGGRVPTNLRVTRRKHDHKYRVVLTVLIG